MSESIPVKPAASPNLAASAASAAFDQTVSIRVSPNSYLIALCLLTFLTGWLVYLEKDSAALTLFVFSWTLFPILAWSDRIVFDGKRLTRTGFLPNFWARFNHAKYRLRINDVEQVESQALRALKRGGNVFYRYRTSLQGKGLKFAFASGGEEYRQMIQRVLPLVSENALDNRSIELRDHLNDPKDTLMKAAFAHIPSAEVLESSFRQNNKNLRPKLNRTDEAEKADYLHNLGNELRLSGYLLQALEAFRRALLLNPNDARLIFDFARCLHSFAGSEKNVGLKRKAFAALRLAEKRAATDDELLARLGETYFQYGDWRRASVSFNKSVEASETNFRAARGLAEIALREGKIGYVILHFSVANRLAETAALRRWTQNENDYFARLQSDEDYMEMEISRVNLLENLERAKKTCLKISYVGFPLIIAGLISDQILANLGWAIAGVSLILWLGLLLGQRMLLTRIPMDFADEN
ncbi:MAG: tetratricopeptide repeat protein [Acidobacteriota bacterium]|nr:tetratricopeptide repeat protein [Acidobacteriota bacterium]